jgi:hypothetical protein
MQVNLLERLKQRHAGLPFQLFNAVICLPQLLAQSYDYIGRCGHFALRSFVLIQCLKNDVSSFARSNRHQ